ncbi:MAG: alpha/beta hydrolase family protein [Bryobacteraceae bacterium]
MAKISRRSLVSGALAAPALAQTEQAKYTGALDGMAARVAMPQFDPLIWAREQYRSAKLQLTFKASNRKQAEAWQKKLRAKVVELMGGFPHERVPLEPQTLETREFDGYRREKIVFHSRPGVMVLAYLLTPKNGKSPYAPMICLPGHGRGVDDIVGIDDKGRERTGKAGYQHDFAIQAAEHGMAAVAIEQMAFGCRRDKTTLGRSLGTSACQPLAGAALLMGQTMIGWRVWDVMRTIDWIATRSELDSTRVGCMGISGGGQTTLWSAAVDPRIQVAYISGHLCTFLDSIFSIAHCIDNYVPGVLDWAEMYDVAGLIAPRPLFVESGDRDNIFPVEAAKQSFERTRRVYEVFGAADKAEQEVFSGEHSFHGVKGLPFSARHLRV